MSDYFWRYCGHCDEFFWPRNGASQKYCSASCSAKSQVRAPLQKSHARDPLAVMAEACAKFVNSSSRREAVTPRELSEWIEGYSALSENDRFRVNVLTCTHLGMSFDCHEGEFLFWSKARQQQGEAIVRAARFA